jgi:hypothetical protein
MESKGKLGCGKFDRIQSDRGHADDCLPSLRVTKTSDDSLPSVRQW